MVDKRFRFQDMEIWKKAATISGSLFDVAEKLDEKRLYRFAEQLRAATLSITNNIAEGSGSSSDSDFRNFLNIARRSVFEVANILVLLTRYGYIDEKQVEPWLDELVDLSKMIFGFMKRLGSGS